MPFNLKCLFIVTLAVLQVSCSNQNQKYSSKTDGIELKIDSILSTMTLVEKIGQTAQRGTSSREKNLPDELKEAVRKGKVGSMLNVMNSEFVKELQSIAVNESPNGIPLIFGRDVIHGFKTIFPIPLGLACTWNPELVEKGARIAAIEASTAGIKWTFAPMLDISRDPRWGRIAESSGEDPYLTSEMAKAYVRGFQGENLSGQTSIAACAKHFVGYGAAEGGRDYNIAIIHDQLLHNVYLKPFHAAVNSGVATVMTSFNELNGIPASANKYILKIVLREEWNFDGFVVSDWNSITEMIPHGFAENKKEAAQKASNSGLDMEMTSNAYELHLKELIDEGKLSIALLDEMVRNILRIKFRLGLFDTSDFPKDKSVLYAKEHLDAAKQAAVESTVLLKNKNKLLPISTDMRKIAVIGPMADAPHEQLGTWTFDGEREHTQTPLMALRKSYGESKIIYTQGLGYSRDKSEKGFTEAIAGAKQSDIVLFFAGEEAILSGEAHSRADITLPGKQEELIKLLARTGKPIVLVVIAGRPLILNAISDKVNAILYCFHPGTMGGPALADLLSGKISPSGRLPVTWPKSVGQIPIYYNHKNTGRPASKETFIHIDDIPIGAWQSSLGNTSHYLDDGYKPQYPFGYGLSYTQFQYSDFTISSDSIAMGSQLNISVNITNTGVVKATETVQLYVQDITASITRPVRELVRFKRVEIEPEHVEQVNFTLSTDDLKFYNLQSKWVTETGKFNIWVSKNSMQGLKKEFKVY